MPNSAMMPLLPRFSVRVQLIFVDDCGNGRIEGEFISSRDNALFGGPFRISRQEEEDNSFLQGRGRGGGVDILVKQSAANQNVVLRQVLTQNYFATPCSSAASSQPCILQTSSSVHIRILASPTPLLGKETGGGSVLPTFRYARSLIGNCLVVGRNSGASTAPLEFSLSLTTPYQPSLFSFVASPHSPWTIEVVFSLPDLLETVITLQIIFVTNNGQTRRVIEIILATISQGDLMQVSLAMFSPSFGCFVNSTVVQIYNNDGFQQGGAGGRGRGAIGLSSQQTVTQSYNAGKGLLLKPQSSSSSCSNLLSGFTLGKEPRFPLLFPPRNNNASLLFTVTGDYYNKGNQQEKTFVNLGFSFHFGKRRSQKKKNDNLSVVVPIVPTRQFKISFVMELSSASSAVGAAATTARKNKKNCVLIALQTQVKLASSERGGESSVVLTPPITQENAPKTVSASSIAQEGLFVSAYLVLTGKKREKQRCKSTYSDLQFNQQYSCVDRVGSCSYSKK